MKGRKEEKKNSDAQNVNCNDCGALSKGRSDLVGIFLLAFIPSSLSSISQFLIFFVVRSIFIRPRRQTYFGRASTTLYFGHFDAMRCDAILISVRVGLSLSQSLYCHCYYVSLS